MSRTAIVRPPGHLVTFRPMPTGYSVVFITVPDSKTADKLSRTLLEEKLAACVNQVPGIKSSYWWEGKIEHSRERLLVAKTRKALMRPLIERVQKNHPYSTPEIIGLPITQGYAPYLAWIGENTTVKR